MKLNKYLKYNMKTPKEKAKELFRKVYLLDHKVWQDTAKQCALIMVDEMINEYPNQCPKDSYEYERHLYWQEVRNEINNL